MKADMHIGFVVACLALQLDFLPEVNSADDD